MAAKKVDALEERFEGEMSQIKATMEDRLSSVEGKVSSMEDKVSDLHLMMKKIFENQIQMTASEAKGPVGRTTNSDVRRREGDGEISEEKGGRYRERCGNREQGERGAGWERKEGNYGRMGADFGEKREEKPLSGLFFSVFLQQFSLPNNGFLLFFGTKSGFFSLTKIRVSMVAKKVGGLEERLEGEMNQIKAMVEDRISSMEEQFSNLRDMVKKMLDLHNQTAASEARGLEGKNTNYKIHRDENGVEIVEGQRRRPHLEHFQREERGGRYGERRGYVGYEQRGVDWKRKDGDYSRRDANFEGRGDSKKGTGHKAKDIRDDGTYNLKP
ncbi:hypothetical protein M5K25_016285 [Dendrobium thyrsiflorum]|uniref:Uncharacterized protein n=1 Tax=Dendrobium thyrsiflorum TaxID=117978 RepID=A0ABD0UJV4_DENTH